MDFPVDTLPKEILHTIFLFLKVPDRLNATLVCKKWLDVMNTKSLLRDIKVLINDNNTVPLFVQSSRNFMNFKFKMIIVDNFRYYRLFERISSTVEYLSFEHCEIWKREPVKFDLNFDNLKVLESLMCDLWSLFPNVPNLTELYLSGESTITDDGIAVLQKTMKHLETFKIDSSIAFEKMVFKRFYINTTYESNPSNLILSLPAITSFISERAATIKDLRFYLPITTKALREVLSIKNLSLHKLELSCSETQNSFLILLRNHPHLKVLKLYCAYSIRDDDIEALCVLLPNIEELSVKDADITSSSLNSIFHLQKLKKLRIEGRHCNAEKRSKFLKAFSSLPLIHSLDISGSTFRCIALLINLCSNLVHLNLSGCVIKDQMVHLISTKLIKLRHLYLSRTPITDYGLTGIDRRDEPNHVTEDESVPLSNLKHLKFLKLNECQKITKFGLLESVHFEHLEYLNVCGCNIDAPTIGILIQQNPSIRKIFCDDNLKTENSKRSITCV